MIKGYDLHYVNDSTNMSGSLTGISNGFHLVDIMVVNNVVKRCVKFVEEVHNLVRSAAAGQLGEAHNITAETENI